MHILEEIVENCSAQKNWSARMLVSHLSSRWFASHM